MASAPGTARTRTDIGVSTTAPYVLDSIERVVQVPLPQSAPATICPCQSAAGPPPPTVVPGLLLTLVYTPGCTQAARHSAALLASLIMQDEKVVGPLLSFCDPRKEAAFLAEFTLGRCAADTSHFSHCIPFQLLVTAKFLASGERLIGSINALQVAWFIVLAWWAMRQHPFYLRHRSALLGALHIT